MKIETMIVIAVLSVQGCIGLYLLIMRFKKNRDGKKIESKGTQ